MAECFRFMPLLFLLHHNSLGSAISSETHSSAIELKQPSHREPVNDVDFIFHLFSIWRNFIGSFKYCAWLRVGVTVVGCAYCANGLRTCRIVEWDESARNLGLRRAVCVQSIVIVSMLWLDLTVSYRPCAHKNRATSFCHKISSPYKQIVNLSASRSRMYVEYVYRMQMQLNLMKNSCTHRRLRRPGSQHAERIKRIMPSTTWQKELSSVMRLTAAIDVAFGPNRKEYNAIKWKYRARVRAEFPLPMLGTVQLNAIFF